MFHSRNGVIGNVPHLTGLVIITFVGWWSSPSLQNIPRRNLETFHSSQLLGCSGNCLQRGTRNRRHHSTGGLSWPHLGPESRLTCGRRITQTCSTMARSKNDASQTSPQPRIVAFSGLTAQQQKSPFKSGQQPTMECGTTECHDPISGSTVREQTPPCQEVCPTV